MKLFRQRIAVFITSLIAMCTWFVASSHCALGLMPEADECELHSDHAHETHHEEHSVPSKDHKDGDDDSTCCKTLQIAISTQAKNLVNHDSDLFTLHAFFIAVFSYPDSFVLRLNPLEIDTGPPRSISFAESVLQRSVLAHAPPFLI